MWCCGWGFCWRRWGLTLSLRYERVGFRYAGYGFAGVLALESHEAPSDRLSERVVGRNIGVIPKFVAGYLPQGP